jgi:hypothetical protein
MFIILITVWTHIVHCTCLGFEGFVPKPTRPIYMNMSSTTYQTNLSVTPPRAASKPNIALILFWWTTFNSLVSHHYYYYFQGDYYYYYLLLIKGSSYIAHRFPLWWCGISKWDTILHFAYVAPPREVVHFYLNIAPTNYLASYAIYARKKKQFF